MSNYSRAIVNAIETFLTNLDWNYRFDEDNGIFHFGTRLKGKIKTIKYYVFVHEDSFSTIAVSPIEVDHKNPEEIAVMAQFLCRANYGLRNGNFELDVRDGEIRYKSFNNIRGMEVSREVIKDSIFVSAAMFERYSQGIVGIIYGGLDAKEAMDLCEGRAREHLRRLLVELEGGSAQSADAEDGTEGEDGEVTVAGEESGGGSEEDAFETTLRLLREALHESGEE